MSVKDAATAYITAHKPAWRNLKHVKQWGATLESYAYPVLGNLPVQAIDVGLVLRVLEPIWTEKAETASRLRGRIEAILDWATARGYRRGDNPARWKGHMQSLLPARSKVQRVQHHPALPYDEIAKFMTHLRRQEGVASRALEFLILTAARTSEVIGATWGEINLHDATWIIPGERIKAGREHRVPLSAAAISLLKKMRKIRQIDGDAVPIFPGQRKVSTPETKCIGTPE